MLDVSDAHSAVVSQACTRQCLVTNHVLGAMSQQLALGVMILAVCCNAFILGLGVSLSNFTWSDDAVEHKALWRGAYMSTA